LSHGSRNQQYALYPNPSPQPLTSLPHTTQLDFYDFDFDDDLLDGIDAMGYRDATPVQEQVIPAVLKGKDVIAAAQTGTGKTAAFLLPILQKLISEPHSGHSINALILVPTRELAQQISQTLEGVAYYTNVSFVAVYGGSDGNLFASEKKALTSGADIVIATPGRLLAHLKMNYLKFPELRYLVLDEADRMLDMGFYDDVMTIINALPKQRQNLFFSATMPQQMRKLVKTIMVEPVEVNIAISKAPERIVQAAFHVFEHQKDALVQLLLGRHESQTIIIFCSSKENVKKLTSTLYAKRFPVKAIHSDLEQSARDQTMLDFRNRKFKILVATNIISRGIDIEDIDLIINYNVPGDAADYVHRIGRTARASSTGTAYTLVGEREQQKLAQIEKLLGDPIPKREVPPELGPVPTPGSASPNKTNKRYKGSRPKRP
jgi:ATP-dependent RNA helicase RhlE